MKKIFIIVTSLLLVWSCAKDTVNQTNISTLKGDRFIQEDFVVTTNSKTGNLEQNVTYSNSFTYATVRLRELVNNPNTTHFRLILKSEDKMIFPLSAFANNDEELGKVGGTPEDRDLELEQLSQVADVPVTEINAQGEIVSQHIIQASTAYNGITEWNALLNSNNSLTTFTSYDGEDIQYFIIEKAVVAKIISEEETDQIVLTFALNSERKLTPILTNAHYNNGVNENTYLYDVTTPYPPFYYNAH